MAGPPVEGPPIGQEPLKSPDIAPAALGLPIPEAEVPVTPEDALKNAFTKLGAPVNYLLTEEDIINAHAIFKAGQAGEIKEGQEGYDNYIALLDAGFRLPEEPPAEEEADLPDWLQPDWLRDVRDAAAPLAPGETPAPERSAPAPVRESVNAVTARLALEASRGARGRVGEVYKRANGLLDVLGRRAKAILKDKTQSAPESVAIQYNKGDLTNPDVTKRLVDQQRDNRDGVTGRKDTPGYLDELVVKVAGELEGLEEQRVKLEESRRSNEGAIGILPINSEIVGQTEEGNILMTQQDVYDREMKQWNALSEKQKRGRNAVPQPKLEDFPVHPTETKRGQVPKLRDADEYIFDPEQADPVIKARENLDKAVQAERDAASKLKQFCEEEGLTDRNRPGYAAWIDVMQEAELSCSNTSAELATKLTDVSSDTAVKSKILDLAKKINLTEADKKSFDISTIEGLFRYFEARKSDPRLQGYEQVTTALNLADKAVENATSIYQARQLEAGRWSVDSQGRQTGAGYKELVETNRQMDSILTTLGDSAIIDLYLQEAYLPTAEEGTLIGDAQNQIAGINTDIAAINVELNRLQSKKQGETSEDILASYNREIEKNYRQKQDLEGQQSELLESISQIINPTARLRSAAEDIGELIPSRVKSKLALLGLSTENIPQSLERVGDAVTQTLAELHASGKVPSELELYGMVITKLRGEPAPEIVETPPVPEPPPVPAKPGVPPASGGETVPTQTQEQTPTDEQRRGAAQALAQEEGVRGRLTVEQIMDLEEDLYPAVEILHRQKTVLAELTPALRKARGLEILEVIRRINNTPDAKTDKSIRLAAYKQFGYNTEAVVMIEAMLKLGKDVKEIANHASDLLGKLSILKYLPGFMTFLPILLQLFEDKSVAASAQGGQEH
ncbi:hypothetical protein A3D03_01640 [Candidatus Gottesmanbacteria bacterium RIFCSPHIGHO2_02_FULL_40_13]|uniref:Uncharacterized protein n=1 Tax=Candidatus Gottesmanbacteria bacterium RIFCSPHIGHO2_02_FULL_40_13 TaxID=1798384 RepID=A0A1F6A6X5_9BACT|nr:MAG: hypothetical protein A3D03_01640 [Candidatus Gottesmanbacteria bacterium RIFCSPHIGHO2_02_FULL_40_13]